MHLLFLIFKDISIKIGILFFEKLISYTKNTFTQQLESDYNPAKEDNPENV